MSAILDESPPSAWNAALGKPALTKEVAESAEAALEARILQPLKEIAAYAVERAHDGDALSIRLLTEHFRGILNAAIDRMHVTLDGEE